MESEIKLTRNIKPEIERELWARTAGRCQFNGCNRLLYKSPVTQEAVNISERAHIYSFAENGPRGHKPYKSNLSAINEIENLMLVCHDCHKLIDGDKKGKRYSAKLLKNWKQDHEKRVTIVTGICPSKKSCVVIYGANIGEEKSILHPKQAQSALFPNWYPSEEKPICLEMKWEKMDDQEDYWKIEEENLQKKFESRIKPIIEEGLHFSIFGLAPIPLLIKLGALFTDKIPAAVYQLQREPTQSWKWCSGKDDICFKVSLPRSYKYPPALIISLSSNIAHDRITSVVGPDASIWELTIENPQNDFLKNPKQLAKFRKTVRVLMVKIAKEHGIKTPLVIFPSMPIAAAIEFGRVRMPKADMPWIIYDQNNKLGAFVKAILIK